MANIIYLKLNGKNQGLISKGCSTIASIGNKFQEKHKDEILVYSMSLNLSRNQNVSFNPIDIKKPIDKSSPLLAQCLTNNEKINCEFYFYRTSINGGLELYYKIKLTNAEIVNLTCFYPSSETHNEFQPQEEISIKYESITWEHIIAGTSSYSLWEDRVY
ncbi:TPA: Hcp family type VI secretion system effector [Proteus mirabilis]|nr:Hcp family type VI secretion system effector [Proteus mirabilis]